MADALFPSARPRGEAAREAARGAEVTLTPTPTLTPAPTLTPTLTLTLLLTLTLTLTLTLPLTCDCCSSTLMFIISASISGGYGMSRG